MVTPQPVHLSVTTAITTHRTVYSYLTNNLTMTLGSGGKKTSNFNFPKFVYISLVNPPTVSSGGIAAN